MSEVVSKTDQRSAAYASQAMRSFLGAPNIHAYARYGSRWRKPWSAKEIETLEEMAGKVHAAKIAAKLGRTESATRKMAYMLNLRLPVIRVPVPEFNAEQEQRARDIFMSFPPRMREIMKAVSDERGVSLTLILGRSRKAKIARARQHMIWRLVRDTSLTMSGAALRLGLDHTTARHAVLVEDKRQGTNVHAKRSAETLRAKP